MRHACPRCGRPTDRPGHCADCDGRLSGWAWERLMDRILLRDGFRCALCRGIATTVDHIRPISLGGSNDPGNLRSMCPECHDLRHSGG